MVQQCECRVRERCVCPPEAGVPVRVAPWRRPITVRPRATECATRGDVMVATVGGGGGWNVAVGIPTTQRPVGIPEVHVPGGGVHVCLPREGGGKRGFPGIGMASHS